MPVNLQSMPSMRLERKGVTKCPFSIEEFLKKHCALRNYSRIAPRD